MRKAHVLVGPALFTAVLLASCGVESPTGARPSPDGAMLAKATESCVFLTPNGKAHTVPAASSRCPSPKPAAQVAGTYELTQFTFRQLEDGEISQQYDVADELGVGGAEFELTLHPNGTTSGTFYVPPTEGESGSGIEADLEGTWRLDGSTVVIDTEEDSIIDLVQYTYADGKLTAGPAIVGDPSDPLYIDEVILTRQ